MTLFEIDSKLREVLDHLYEVQVDPETGELVDGGTSFIDITELNEERNKKLEHIGMYMKELDATIEAYTKEIERFKAKIKSLENKHKNLETYVITSMQSAGEKKFESMGADMTIRESEFVNIEENIDLPIEYVRVKTEYSPDKTELKKALKSGKIIEGVTLGKRINLNVK